MGLKTASFSQARQLTVASAALLGGLVVVAAQVATGYLRGNKGPSQLLAVVDDHPITVQEFQAEMLRRGGEANFTTPRQRRALLEDMIRTDVLASNAQKAGYPDNPEVHRAINRLLAEKYQRDTIDEPLAELQVSDGDIEDYYRSHIADFTAPESIHAAIIFVEVPTNATDEERQARQQRAERARQLAQGPTPGFAELAKQYSDDQDSRAQGGDIGWLTEGESHPRIDKPVLDKIFAIDNPWQLSPLLSSGSGFYIVKRLDGHPSQLRPLTEVRNSIRQQLMREERLRRASKLYANALTNVHVTVNEAGIAAMDAAEQAVMDLPHGPPPEPRG